MAVRSMQRSPEGHLALGLGHPSPEHTSRCANGSCSAQHRRGEGGVFPALPCQAQPRQLLGDGLFEVLHCAICLVLDLELVSEDASSLAQKLSGPDLGG